MDDNADFYTQKGYQLKNCPAVTGAMEDYLEMICREGRSEGFGRINTLAGKLNVRPSSASKMVYNLRSLELAEHFLTEEPVRSLERVPDILEGMGYAPPEG